MNLVGPELGARLIAEVKRAEIGFVAALPDIVTSAHLLWPIARDPDLRLVRICKEDEGLAIAAGLAACGKRALVMMQQTGLLDSLNALRAVGVELEQPICLLVGLQGREAGVTPADSAAYGVRIVEPLLDAMGIVHFMIGTTDDAARLAPAVSAAYAESRPLVGLL